jgi:general secretion pathway protein A
MYEGFFQLRSSPFRMNPDPGSIFMTPSHREAFSVLLYAISQRRGFVVLTGDAGTGKTSLLRALIQSVADVKFSVVLTPRVSADEFLELVLLDFGATDIPQSKAQRINKLQELLVEIRTQGKSAVLLVDEAHTLSAETLEEIRLLTNFETTQEKLLQIVLAGQNDLVGMLNRHDLRQLKQRIEIRADLKPLDAGMLGEYIEYRWVRAGGSIPAPFTLEAIAMIARASKGIPRVVNCLCDNALLLAYAEGESQIHAQHIRSVLRDLDYEQGSAVKNTGKRLTLRDLDRPVKEEPAVEWNTKRVLSGIVEEQEGEPEGIEKALVAWAGQQKQEGTPVRTRRTKKNEQGI